MLFTTFTILAVAFTIASWIYSIAFLTLVAENYRFWRVHQKKPVPITHTYACANVIIPCKGMEHKLRENLSALMHQDHPNYEVTFVVERATDPAVQLIRNLQKENRCIKTRLVVAGRTEDCGQKVHNLRRATEDLPIDVDVLVFADSDANPKSTWLRWIVNRIGRENLGARTGYRWMVPKNKKVPTLLGCTINNALTSFLGRGKHYLVWGGSWAIHRKIFDAVGIREAWSGVLSDDLVASRALKSANLEIEFEPQCVCTTVVEFNWATLTEFMRRQLLIGRRYSPVYWLASLIIVVTSQVGFWGGLIGGIAAVSAGDSIGYWFLASSAGLYLLGVARAGIRQNIGRSNDHTWRSYRRAKKIRRAVRAIYRFSDSRNDADVNVWKYDLLARHQVFRRTRRTRSSSGPQAGYQRMAYQYEGGPCASGIQRPTAPQNDHGKRINDSRICKSRIKRRSF